MNLSHSFRCAVKIFSLEVIFLEFENFNSPPFASFHLSSFSMVLQSVRSRLYDSNLWYCNYPLTGLSTVTSFMVCLWSKMKAVWDFGILNALVPSCHHNQSTNRRGRCLAIQLSKPWTLYQVCGDRSRRLQYTSLQNNAQIFLVCLFLNLKFWFFKLKFLIIPSLHTKFFNLYFFISIIFKVCDILQDFAKFYK